MSSLNDCQNKLIIWIMKILFLLSSPGEKACYWLYLYWYTPQALYCNYAVLFNLSNSVWNNVGDWLADVWLVGQNFISALRQLPSIQFALQVTPVTFCYLYFSSWCTLSSSRRDPFLPDTTPTRYKAPIAIFSCPSFQLSTVVLF